MNSSVSDNSNREHLALEAANCLKNIFGNFKNTSRLHKELLEINLSLTAYIEESKRRQESLRLELAQQARSSFTVVEVFKDKCKTMSRQIEEIHQCNMIDHSKLRAGRKVTQLHSYNLESARKFISWYERMIDNERTNLRLYLAENVNLEWFGRTIRTKKKVSAFFNYDMHCSRHNFKTVECIDKIQSRQELQQNKDDSILASPLQSPEFNKKKLGKRKLDLCMESPEWAEGCKPSNDKSSSIEKKKIKKSHTELIVYEDSYSQSNASMDDNNLEINHKGDSGKTKLQQNCDTITPPNIECGQGDCLPSTSGTASKKPPDTGNNQLTKLAVECNGFVEFNRSKTNHNIDSPKWDRQCKVQISYSEDPLHIGEYIIWAIVYNDESRCRRNLLSAFEDAAKDDLGISNSYN